MVNVLTPLCAAQGLHGCLWCRMADPSPAYLQQLFAGNFQETFKCRGEAFPLGKSVEMQCLLLDPDLSVLSLAARSQGRQELGPGQA